MEPDLAQARFRARKLTNEYNTHFPDDATPESLEEDRRSMLNQLMRSIGRDSYIDPPVQVDYGSNISIGRDLYANFNLVILDSALVTIGNRVLIGPSVSIFAVAHDAEVASRWRRVTYAKPVTIGDDCWIGGNVTVMPGVTIGKGCTVGAGSVVTGDVPDFCVAAGVPARVVKRVEAVPDLE